MRLGKNNQPEVGAAEFMKVCQERDALQKENEDLRNQNGLRSEKIDELRRGGDTLQELLDATRKERDSAQLQLKTVKKINDSLMDGIKQLKAQATEAHGQFQKRVKELGDGLDASTALLKTAQDERDAARREADRLLKCGQEAEERAVQLQEQIKVQEALLDQQRADCERALSERDALRKRYQEAEDRVVGFQAQLTAQEEVIERLKAQNSNFCEEQREAKRQLNLKQMELASSKDEIGRLVRLADDFKVRLEDVKKEKNAVLEISNNFARERDEIQAEYDARGRVIKKLRKRLHKLKKKLKR